MVYVNSLKISVDVAGVIRYGIAMNPPTKNLFGKDKKNGEIFVQFYTSNKDWYGAKLSGLDIHRFAKEVVRVEAELKEIFFKSAPASEEARNSTEQVPAQNFGQESNEKNPGT